MSQAEFEAMMRRQLKLYVQRQLANAMELVDDASPERPGTTFFVLKLLLIGVDELQGRLSPCNLGTRVICTPPFNL